MARCMRRMRSDMLLLRFRVQGSGFRFQVSGFRVEGLGSRAEWVSGFRASRSKVEGVGCRV